MDAFSQRILGPVDEVKLPEIGKTYYQDHICLALLREGRRAAIEAPVDGVIESVNSQVRQRPGLIHDDPYGEGWLFTVKPTNLQQNLDNLFYGESNVTWIEQESQRLFFIMSTTLGSTLPMGGAILDDVCGHHPRLTWRRLVKEFFLTNLTKNWKKR
jgi:glycine cleavage system H protein